MKVRLLVCLLVAAGAAACDLPTPTAPTYARDVRPIFLSHCIRCHGAGDTLQGDPPPKDGTAPEPGDKTGPPKLCYLNSFDDQGDCVPQDGGADPATCRRGAHYCAGVAAAYSLGPNPMMPPPPSPDLTDWEKEVLRRWAANPLQ